MVRGCGIVSRNGGHMHIITRIEYDRSAWPEDMPGFCRMEAKALFKVFPDVLAIRFVDFISDPIGARIPSAHGLVYQLPQRTAHGAFLGRGTFVLGSEIAEQGLFTMLSKLAEARRQARRGSA